MQRYNLFPILLCTTIRLFHLPVLSIRHLHHKSTIKLTKKIFMVKLGLRREACVFQIDCVKTFKFVFFLKKTIEKSSFFEKKCREICIFAFEFKERATSILPSPLSKGLQQHADIVLETQTSANKNDHPARLAKLHSIILTIHTQ